MPVIVAGDHQVNRLGQQTIAGTNTNNMASHRKTLIEPINYWDSFQQPGGDYAKYPEQ